MISISTFSSIAYHVGVIWGANSCIFIGAFPKGIISHRFSPVAWLREQYLRPMSFRYWSIALYTPIFRLSVVCTLCTDLSCVTYLRFTHFAITYWNVNSDSLGKSRQRLPILVCVRYFIWLKQYLSVAIWLSCNLKSIENVYSFLCKYLSFSWHCNQCCIWGNYLTSWIVICRNDWSIMVYNGHSKYHLLLLWTCYVVKFNIIIQSALYYVSIFVHLSIAYSKWTVVWPIYSLVILPNITI